ncbi:unnamed protein product [Parajaminaea phylloscopi]
MTATVSADHIAQLKTAFSGAVLKPEDDAFKTHSVSWGLQANVAPQLVLQPADTKDVASALSWVTRNNIPFAVRSGGMMPASQTSGVIISLARLDKVQLSADKDTLVVGPGNTWRKVFDTIASEPDVTVLGGRVGFVGVGGYILGGGLSYLVSEHGFCSDTLVEAQVVLADGSIVKASEDKDLLFALRGAGSNFGIVTEFILKTVPKPKKVWSGRAVFPIQSYSKVAQAVQDFTESNTDTRAGVLFVSMRPPPDFHHVAIVMPIFFGDAAEAEKVFSWLDDLSPLMKQVGPIDWETLGRVQDEGAIPPGQIGAWQTSVVPRVADVKTYEAALEWQNSLAAKDPRYAGAVLLMEPFVNGAFSKVDDETSAYPHQSEAMTVIALLVACPDPSLQPEADLREGVAKIAAASPRGVLPQYPGYAMLAGEKAQDYYGKHTHKLQQLKARYDPEGVFKGALAL